MRDATVNAPAAAEEKRVRDAIETARVRLYWTLVWDRRWEDSRWSGQSPEVEWEKGFYDALKIAGEKINDPVITAALERARPRPRKKGELRKQMNALRDQQIAEVVALTCKDGFYIHRGSATKDHERRESACSIVAEALRQLGLKRLGERRIEAIWDKHKKAYNHLLHGDNSSQVSSDHETDT